MACENLHLDPHLQPSGVEKNLHGIGAPDDGGPAVRGGVGNWKPSGALHAEEALPSDEYIESRPVG